MVLCVRRRHLAFSLSLCPLFHFSKGKFRGIAVAIAACMVSGNVVTAGRFPKGVDTSRRYPTFTISCDKLVRFMCYSSGHAHLAKCSSLCVLSSVGGNG